MTIQQQLNNTRTKGSADLNYPLPPPPIRKGWGCPSSCLEVRITEGFWFHLGCKSILKGALEELIK